MIISLRYSQSLPYSTFLMCWVHWYEFNLIFASIRGRVSLISLFSFYEFFLWGFSYKVFNEAISTQGHVISSIFPMGFLVDDTRTCIALFSLCEFSVWGFSYKVFDEAMPAQRYMLYHLFSPTGVFGRWYLKHIDHRVKALLD